MTLQSERVTVERPAPVCATDVGQRRTTDRRRLLQLTLAGLWLIDGVLQLQPFMFTTGRSGFSGMLNATADGNPQTIAQSIHWNASIVSYHPGLTNGLFALIQVLIGLGIAGRRTVKPALAASIVWSLGVWWFGEGLGGVLHGDGTPIGGGPGAVLFYALLAVVLWPAERGGAHSLSVAARGVGEVASKAMWAVLWALMAFLTMIGSGRSPQGVRDVIDHASQGEPSWLATLDRHVESLISQQGLTVAVVLTATFLVVAVAIFLPPPFVRATLVVAMVTAAVIWLFGQNLGMILAGGTTDPNSGPLLVVLALAYWPLRPHPATQAASTPGIGTAGQLAKAV